MTNSAGFPRRRGWWDPDLAICWVCSTSTSTGISSKISSPKRFSRLPCSPQLARRFLDSEDATQRMAVSDALLFDRFAQRKTMDLSSEKFGERAQPVYEALSYDIAVITKLRQTQQQLELLLCSIKWEPFIEDLLVPCLLPDVLTHREKVEDAVAHARLMLIEADANIFYGCSFNCKYAALWFIIIFCVC
ncbi:uncharacterized protein LOC9660483 isoform X1 [Selaginella moellendorffii]|uniref:uncharacterized protein LOC9660483 isoform X1 n=1 Tax=Selaginella moellendorffii TaxID=88036 RepID=UPI000D1CDBAF|nr:uncharacterized protein LOC9660483 isoform X1 [Selaginella moellendorffii]|eukprot:XP_024525688.1 uncharacterized protein LOC9660483 isoform X1 [Selaginella moellendorffii]